MNERRKVLSITLLLLALDIFFIVLADLASFIIRFNGQFPQPAFNAYLELAPFIIMLRLGSFYIFHLYVKPKYKSNFEIMINTIKAATASSIVIIFAVYFLDIQNYPRFIAIISWLLTIISITCWRFVIKEFVQFYLGKDYFRAHLLIIGTDRRARETAIYALRDASIEYKFLGYVRCEGKDLVEVDEKEIVGNIDDLASILRRYPIDEIIIAESNIDETKMSKLIKLVGQHKIILKSIPSTYETVIGDMVLHKHDISFVGPTIFTKPISWYWGLKRILDIFFAAVILILCLPVLVTAIILTKMTSPGPVFYPQKRTGLNGKRFTMFKLRTMYVGYGKKRHPGWSTEIDQSNVTGIGKFLRRFRIDELPQLVNVLRNEMSIIGPRPEWVYFTSKLVRKIPFYAERLRVKPGITGWAQVNFKYAVTEEEREKKLLYDIFYIQNMSFALDLLIALKTLKVIATGMGAK